MESLLDFKNKCYIYLILKNKNNLRRIFVRTLNKITKYNNFKGKFLPNLYKKLKLRNVTQNLHVYLINKINVIFSPFCTTKTFSREVLVEFTHFHYMQEFLQKLCQKTPKTLILRNLTQNKRFIRF